MTKLIIFAVLLGLSNATAPLSQSLNSFSYNFLKEVSLAKTENVLFSGLSIASAFSMLLAGARERSESQLISSLQYGTRSAAEVHNQFRDVLRQLSPRNPSPSQYEMKLANKVYFAEGYEVQQQFMNDVVNKYLAELQNLNFAQSEEAVRQVNNWVSEHTNGKIPTILSPGMVDGNTVAVLVNAIYFKGSWDGQFDVEESKPGTFYNNGQLDQGKEVTFMTCKHPARFGQSSDGLFTMVELPYFDNASVIVLVPTVNSDCDQILTANSVEEIESTLDQLMRYRPNDVVVEFPKFKLETQYDLIPPMRSLGVNDVFDSGVSDLSGIGSGLFVNPAIHKATVEVSEEGTVASAATALVIVYKGIGSPTPTIRVDKPFLFFIRDNNSKINLFAGKVNAL